MFPQTTVPPDKTARTCVNPDTLSPDKWGCILKLCPTLGYGTPDLGLNNPGPSYSPCEILAIIILLDMSTGEPGPWSMPNSASTRCTIKKGPKS